MQLIQFLLLILFLILYLKGLFAGQMCSRGIELLEEGICPHYNVEQFDTQEIKINNISLNVRWAEINSGNHGVIHHAIMNKCHCVVLKMTNRTNISLNEVKILKELARNHNIERSITLYGYDINDEISMVLELGGKNLLDYFKEKIMKQFESGNDRLVDGNELTVFGENLLTKIIIGAVLTIEEFHQFGIHMDIKAQNFVIDLQKQEEIDVINSKLIDFGHSVLKHKLVLKHEQIFGTRGENKIGTDLYIAPEIEFSEEDSFAITNKVDIYSFGVMIFKLRQSLYEPFDRKELEEFKENLNNNCNTILERVMRASLQFKPEDRPSISAVRKFIRKDCNIFMFENRMIMYNNVNIFIPQESNLILCKN